MSHDSEELTMYKRNFEREMFCYKNVSIVIKKRIMAMISHT